MRIQNVFLVEKINLVVFDEEKQKSGLKKKKNFSKKID
jgi:hypothetical protein